MSENSYLWQIAKQGKETHSFNLTMDGKCANKIIQSQVIGLSEVFLHFPSPYQDPKHLFFAGSGNTR